MAGGENAKSIVCPTCLYQAGQIVVAERTNEGQETDWYLCEHQHKNGISWDGEELPSQPLWPASQKDKQTAQLVIDELAKGADHNTIMKRLIELKLL